MKRFRDGEDYVDERSNKRFHIDEIQQLLNTNPMTEEVLNKLVQIATEPNVALTDLTYQVLDGPNKGTSTLWWVAVAAFKGRPQAFLSVWEKFKDMPASQLLVDALSAQAADGPSKGKSALWCLACAATNGNPDAFMAVWDRFKEEPLLLGALLAQAADGPSKGKSALWLLAKAAADGKPEVFQSVWEKFKEEPLLLDALLAPAKEGPEKGKSALWLLAKVAAGGKPEVFQSVWEKFKEEPLLLDALLAPAQEGLEKGQSALMFLACAAEKGHPQVFMSVWNKLKDMYPPRLLEVLIMQVAEGPNKGQSVLWWLAGAACSNSEIFLPVWEIFKDDPLLQKTLFEHVQGISVLWWLAFAAHKGHPQVFMSVWNKLKDVYFPQLFEALIMRADEGPNKGTSGLWLLAAAARKNPEVFLSVWNKSKENYTPQLLEALVIQEAEGPNKGISGLWQLAFAASIDQQPEAFFSVVEEFKDNSLLLKAILAQSEGTDTKSVSALWSLTYAVAQGDPKIFILIWNKLKDMYTPQLLEALIVQADVETNKGQSGLWWLASGAYSNPEVFLSVWEKLKDFMSSQQLFDALVMQSMEGPDKGKSALWGLAYAAFKDKPDAFMTVWDRFKDEPAMLDALLAQASDGPNKGKSALWLIACAAANGKAEIFLSVGEKLKDISTPQLLEGLLAQVPNREKSALCLLMEAAKGEASLSAIDESRGFLSGIFSVFDGIRGLISGPKKQDQKPLGPISSILKNILTQAPGVIPSDLPEVETLIELKIVTPEFIKNKNQFFEAFNRIKSQEEVTEEELETLFDLAKKAQDLGYVNAYYDMGDWLERSDEYRKALEAYDKMLPESSHYKQKAFVCSASWFGQATGYMGEEDEPLRNERLFTALKWALNIENENDRFSQIQKIGSFYILGETKLEAEPVISGDLPALMNANTDVSLCFSVFDIAKAATKEKLQKKSELMKVQKQMIDKMQKEKPKYNKPTSS